MSKALQWEFAGRTARVWQESPAPCDLVRIDLEKSEVFIRDQKYSVVYEEVPTEARGRIPETSIELFLGNDQRCCVGIGDGVGIYVNGRLCGPESYPDHWRAHRLFLEYADGFKRVDILGQTLTLLDEDESSVEALEIITGYLLMENERRG